jgi:hypothetical protein
MNLTLLLIKLKPLLTILSELLLLVVSVALLLERLLVLLLGLLLLVRKKGGLIQAVRETVDLFQNKNGNRPTPGSTQREEKPEKNTEKKE